MQALSMRAFGVMVASGLLLTSAIAGCAVTNESANAITTTQFVRVTSMQFQPATLRIQLGQTVTWNFVGNTDHNVTSDPNAQETFSSPTMSDGSWSYTFKERGTNPYYCTIHSNMAGTVIVQ
ncbi:plastocyanin/azurin family copper-binding protein [Rhodococcus sp. NPDC127528]|uniref:cupredoxin domain-containing protein n=1 Tax=unclassified Rhodococcus (in: high G+C Gram-positive bacteria) TaxID=192944 RepID=UPI0036445100